MSQNQYQRILSIAEGILSKIDLPEDTLVKYEELKGKILEELDVDCAELQVKLQNEFLGVYEHFVSTITTVVSNILGDGSSRSITGNTLNKFVDYFNRTKQVIKETVEEGSRISLESKLTFNKYGESIELLESAFDKIVNLLGSVDELVGEKNDEIKEQNKRIELMEEQLGKTTSLARQTEQLEKEIRTLKLEKDELVFKFKGKDVDLEKTKSELMETERILAGRIEQLDQTNKYLLKNIEDSDKWFDRFSCFFRPYFMKNEAEKFEEKNMSDMLTNVQEMVESIIAENKEMLSVIERKEEDIKGLRTSLKSKTLKTGLVASEMKELIAQSNQCLEEMDSTAASLEHLRSLMSS